MTLDSAALGIRIAQARTDAGQTQAQLAATAGLDRSAVAKIETGARGVSALELARLAQAVGQRVEWLLEDGPAAVVSHRIRRDSESTAATIDRELERLARDVEFVAEQNGALPLPAREPWQVPSSTEDAERLAARVRVELGLDPEQAVHRVVETLAPLGFLVFVEELGPDAADGATVLLERGAVSLVNGTGQRGRRRLTAAHELAHFLVADDYTVDWRVSERATSDQAEALFDRFARAFLLPPEGLRSSWSSVAGDGLRAAAVQVASHFQVDMATLARRLVEIDVLSASEANSIHGIRTTRADIIDFNLLVPYELEQDTLPRAYERAVLSLYRGERISAERALDLLRGRYTSEDLPPLPAAREDELWSILL
ncbi:helix-turn-helix domain-containing protein [Agromyces archimandritae]|nr:XRE family transcriptional regulator [Agromyces archimandritae]